jgi:hypothetical protein
MHVGSTTLHAFVGKHTAASECDKKKPELQAKYTTSPVVPAVALIVPFPGASNGGAHSSASHVGSALLHTFVGKHTDEFA